MTATSTLHRQIVRGYRAVAARPAARRLNELLFDLALHGLGVGNYENDDVSGERHFVRHVLPAHLRDTVHPVVMDVGAHDGAYATMVLQRFPGARVVCAEPHPGTFAALSARLGERATLLDCALGAEPDVLTLYDRADHAEGSQHASMYEGVISDLHGQRPVSFDVPVRTLDDVADELGIRFVHLLKIDTEGHELAVLRGAAGLLAADAVGVVQIEFNEMNLYSRSFLHDFRGLLPNHRAHRLLPRGLTEVRAAPLRSELFGFQNIVFLPSR